ncbi:DNA sulfur modification protein DndE [Stenotrophomonas geniculata]|jgi:DNA sulfur modification protein DndE|uniref:DNA sulfur modification protein DndE n=1 Tax=Stenotrophomonas geniculata TaxID=86188 RepID=UPI0030D423F4
MHYSKLRISKDATSRLRSIKQRTHITPNLLCRYALMQSLEEGPLGDIPLPDQEGQEFNAYTLTGELTELLLALVRSVEERANEQVLSDEALMALVRGHIHRGVGSLSVRAKSPSDLVMLATQAP